MSAYCEKCLGQYLADSEIAHLSERLQATEAELAALRKEAQELHSQLASVAVHAWDEGYAEHNPTGPNPYRALLRRGNGTRAVVEAAIRMSKQRGAWSELIQEQDGDEQ